MMDDLEARVLTVPEAAAFLGVGTSTYYRAARRGQVPAVAIGRRLVVPGRLLEVFLAGPNAGSYGRETSR